MNPSKGGKHLWHAYVLKAVHTKDSWKDLLPFKCPISFYLHLIDAEVGQQYHLAPFYLAQPSKKMIPHAFILLIIQAIRSWRKCIPGKNEIVKLQH